MFVYAYVCTNASQEKFFPFSFPLSTLIFIIISLSLFTLQFLERKFIKYFVPQHSALFFTTRESESYKLQVWESRLLYIWLPYYTILYTYMSALYRCECILCISNCRLRLVFIIKGSIAFLLATEKKRKVWESVFTFTSHLLLPLFTTSMLMRD